MLVRPTYFQFNLLFYPLLIEKSYPSIFFILGGENLYTRPNSLCQQQNENFNYKVAQQLKVVLNLEDLFQNLCKNTFKIKKKQ